MSELSQAPKLNPAQQQVTDELGARPEDRPSFRDDLRDHLRHELEEAIGPLLTELSELPLFISKHDLMMIHGCEARFLAERDVEFAWTVPLARGSVAHKAIELLVTWRGEPVPIDLVEHALARLVTNERSVGLFIQTLDEAERAELAGRANDFVSTFLETFPPLRRQWRPVAESRVRADLCEGSLALQGRVDLSLGKADGNTAGKVLFDLKTGRPFTSHRDDLRFYALLETLKIGVPPRLLVNYYLEAGVPHTESVSEDTLWATARRTAEGVEKIVNLISDGGSEPSTSAGPGCRFCPIANACSDGKAYLTRDDEDRDVPV